MDERVPRAVHNPRPTQHTMHTRPRRGAPLKCQAKQQMRIQEPFVDRGRPYWYEIACRPAYVACWAPSKQLMQPRRP